MSEPLVPRRGVVDDIPLLWFEPPRETRERQLVVWLSGFTGSKEGLAGHLRDLAEMGFVALSFDPLHHGERRITLHDPFPRIASNRRRYFWPALAHTAEETSRVIDWAIETLNVSDKIKMGGISWGGDISLSAAGIDHRITTVAATICTPDWRRTGSDEWQGVPDTYSQRCFDRCCPIVNLDRYRHCPAMTMQCGELDKLVPSDANVTFAETLRPAYQQSPERLDVFRETGIGHNFTPQMWINVKRWFERF